MGTRRGTRLTESTKTGGYMCDRDTTAQGMRASKNEKRSWVRHSASALFTAKRSDLTAL